jgi:hypothetical protein
MPAGKALLMIILFGAIAIISTIGAFSSKKTLIEMSGIIGTKKPTTSRIVCVIGAVVCWIFVIVSFMYLIDKIN